MTIRKPAFMVRRERGIEPTPRARWELRPLDGVGPLSFGMTLPEIVEAVGAEPNTTTHNAQRKLERADIDDFPSVFFDPDERLVAARFAASRGPEVEYDGELLTGRVPSELETWFADHADQHGWDLRYSPTGDPAVEDLGLLMAVERDRDSLISMPIVYGRRWIDDEVFEHGTDIWGFLGMR